MTDKHVWAGKYDRELTDVFAVQDEMVDSIVSEVAPEFLSTEVKRAQRADPTTLNLWDCVMRGRWHLWKLSRGHMAQARGLFERAIEFVRLAPENPAARRQLAAAYSVSGDVEQARHLIQEYLQLEPDHSAANIRGRLRARNLAPVEFFVDVLCDAGLPCEV